MSEPFNAQGPEQAVIDWVSRRRGLAQPPVPREPRGGVHAVVWRGGQPFEADVASLRVHKVRATEHRRVYAVSFRDTRRGRWEWTLPVDAQPDGTWRVAGGAGGGGARPLLGAYLGLFARVRGRQTNGGRPWANLGGGNWPHRFYAGGRVEHDRGRAACVRLTFANGVVLEDTVDDCRVLFVTEDRVEVPAEVELVDRAGHLFARHTEF